MPHLQTIPHLFHCLLFIIALGCQPSGSGRATDPEVPDASPAELAERARERAFDDFLIDYIKTIDANLDNHDTQVEVLETLKRESKKVVAQINDRYLYRSVLRRLYVRNKAPTLHFVNGKGLTRAGDATLAYLKSMFDHGLDIQDSYHTSRVDKALAALNDKSGSDERPKTSITEVDRGRISELARQLYEDGEWSPEHADAGLTLTRKVIALEPPLASVAGRTPIKLGKTARRHLADIEALLVDGVCRYGWDMFYQNRHRFPETAEVKRRERRKILLKRLRDDVEAMFSGREDVVTWMTTRVPRHPQYKLLIEALARYRTYYKAGDWPKVIKAPGLRPNITHEAVPGLKARLAAEGYYPPPGIETPDSYSDLFDDDLEASVKWYQRTHQLEVTGRPHKIFWQSLKVSPKKRVQYIKVALERWRESSLIDPDGYYVLINIPDFHAEVWKDGALLTRFKTVTGNAYWGCDIRSGMWVRINQTPIQHSAIDTIILNPWWSVPERLLREEIIPASKRDPSYLESHGFQCLQREGKDCVRMRQATGDDNALGRVKFLFPSIHNTFLHDTNKKHFFDLPIRAMSHGCVRLEKPRHLAKTLLEQDGQWDEAHFKKRYERRREYEFKLKAPVPIHIDYLTVRVDDDGDVNFLIDAYKHDHFRRIGEPFEPRECTPEELKRAVDPTIDDGRE